MFDESKLNYSGGLVKVGNLVHSGSFFPPQTLAGLKVLIDWTANADVSGWTDVFLTGRHPLLLHVA